MFNKNTSATKKCPQCHTEIPFGAKRCPNCQSDIRNWFFRHPLISLLLFGILASIIMASVSSDSPQPSPQAQTSDNASSTPVAQTASEGKKVSVGEQGFLRDRKDAKEDVLVATTKETFDQFIKAAVAGDNYGAAQIVISGGAFYVPGNTKVLVIDMETGSRKVRILEGEQAGVAGWVPYEYVVSD